MAESTTPPEGAEFLKKTFKDLNTSPEVDAAAQRQRARLRLQRQTAATDKEKLALRKQAGELAQKPAVRIQNYLERLSRIAEYGSERDPEHGLRQLKELLHRSYVITPEEIPESYWETQRRLAREQGHGDIEIPPQVRAQQAEVIVADQESSLDKWVDY